MYSAKVALITAFAFCAIRYTTSKVYKRCELARELRDIHEIPENQLATWICIVKHESSFNTSALNPDSGDHGLFQISQLYWCSPGGHACGVSCSSLEDDDIEDDVICARRIYRQHQRIFGDGFSAWAVYPYYCKGDVGHYINGCFKEDGYDVSQRNQVVEYKSSPVAAISVPAIPVILTQGQEVNARRDQFFTSSPAGEGPGKTYAKNDKVLIYKSAKANYAFNWKANGFRLIKMDTP